MPKAEEFREEEFARAQSQRAAVAINQLAEFVEGLADDDPDLGLKAMSNLDQVLLPPEAFDHLSRFEMQRAAWQDAPGRMSERQKRQSGRKRGELVSIYAALLP
jgi:hypothetical protein